MASTYTPKLNLAKPAHGDVDWHIPVNGNWDILDTKVDSAAKTALLSRTTIDADKNWGGKNITNVNSVDAVTLYGEKIYTGFTVTASDNTLVTFPDRAVSSSEGQVRIVHFVVGKFCQGTSNTLRVSGYVSSGSGYGSIIQVKHNSTTVLNVTVANNGFSVDLSGVKANDVIEIYMSTKTLSNTARQLALKGDATVNQVYPDLGTTL